MDQVYRAHCGGEDRLVGIVGCAGVLVGCGGVVRWDGFLRYLVNRGYFLMCPQISLLFSYCAVYYSYKWTG